MAYSGEVARGATTSRDFGADDGVASRLGCAPPRTLSVFVLSGGVTTGAEPVRGATATDDFVVPPTPSSRARSIAMPSTSPAARSALQPNTTVRERRRGTSWIT